MTIPFAAGALYSTTEDLLRWEQALFAGKVLSAESLKKMTTPFKNDYAFGLVVHGTKSGYKVIEHGGGIEEFKYQHDHQFEFTEVAAARHLFNSIEQIARLPDSLRIAGRSTRRHEGCRRGEVLQRCNYNGAPARVQVITFRQYNCSDRRHSHAVNVCTFLSEVLNVQPTTSNHGDQDRREGD